ncbi:recombination protein NinG [Pantoea sp. FN0307]|uniref:recombination protein NinG n=1 Tax=unclassified Pantoea TaxID=2630326 RepID=UPI003CEC5FAA
MRSLTQKAIDNLIFQPTKRSRLSGNIGEYKPRLIEKVGQEAFDRLMGPHELKKWTRQELQELTALYRQKTRELSKQREAA